MELKRSLPPRILSETTRIKRIYEGKERINEKRIMYEMRHGCWTIKRVSL